jgi:hypothetical protein
MRACRVISDGVVRTRLDTMSGGRSGAADDAEGGSAVLLSWVMLLVATAVPSVRRDTFSGPVTASPPGTGGFCANGEDGEETVMEGEQQQLPWTAGLVVHTGGSPASGASDQARQRAVQVLGEVVAFFERISSDQLLSAADRRHFEEQAELYRAQHRLRSLGQPVQLVAEAAG